MFVSLCLGLRTAVVGHFASGIIVAAKLYKYYNQILYILFMHTGQSHGYNQHSISHVLQLELEALFQHRLR